MKKKNTYVTKRTFCVRCAMFATLLCIASLITFPIGMQIKKICNKICARNSGAYFSENRAVTAAQNNVKIAVTTSD